MKYIPQVTKLSKTKTIPLTKPSSPVRSFISSAICTSQTIPHKPQVTIVKIVYFITLIIELISIITRQTGAKYFIVNI